LPRESESPAHQRRRPTQTMRLAAQKPLRGDLGIFTQSPGVSTDAKPSITGRNEGGDEGGGRGGEEGEKPPSDGPVAKTRARSARQSCFRHRRGCARPPRTAEQSRSRSPRSARASRSTGPGSPAVQAVPNERAGWTERDTRRPSTVPSRSLPLLPVQPDSAEWQASNVNRRRAGGAGPACSVMSAATRRSTRDSPGPPRRCGALEHDLRSKVTRAPSRRCSRSRSRIASTHSYASSSRKGSARWALFRVPGQQAG